MRRESFKLIFEISLVVIFASITTCAFSAPGKRTYKGDEIINNKIHLISSSDEKNETPILTPNNNSNPEEKSITPKIASNQNNDVSGKEINESAYHEISHTHIPMN